MPKKYKEMTPQEKKDRITYLWNKIRLMVSMRGATRELMLEVNKKEREAFGLSDDEEERRLPTEQELESLLPFVTDERTDLPIYLINSESRGAIIWESIN